MKGVFHSHWIIMCPLVLWWGTGDLECFIWAVYFKECIHNALQTIFSSFTIPSNLKLNSYWAQSLVWQRFPWRKALPDFILASSSALAVSCVPAFPDPKLMSSWTQDQLFSDPKDHQLFWIPSPALPGSASPELFLILRPAFFFTPTLVH